MVQFIRVLGTLILYFAAGAVCPKEIGRRERESEDAYSLSATSRSGNLIWSQVIDNNATVCGDSIRGTILCVNDYLKISRCYCVYYDLDRNVSLISNCISTCFHPQIGAYFKVRRYHVHNASVFNRDMCVETSQSFTYVTNCTGRFCGKCKDGHGIAVYSYQITVCILCEDYRHTNWVKYFVISLGPLTFFYIFMVLLRVNLNSSYLTGVVLIPWMMTE